MDLVFRVLTACLHLGNINIRHEAIVVLNLDVHVSILSSAKTESISSADAFGSPVKPITASPR